MNAIQVISLTLMSLVAAGAQSVKPGRCPVPAVQEKFDAAKYLGKWYEIQRVSNSFQKGQCSTATYDLHSPGVVSVLNKELLSNGTIDSISGTAKAASSSEPAKLLVTFFENSPPSPYWVLSTDYHNFALVYSCTEIEISEPLHFEFIWILSRNPTLPKETLKELQSILSSFGARVDKLLDTNQDRDYCRVMHD